MKMKNNLTTLALLLALPLGLITSSFAKEEAPLESASKSIVPSGQNKEVTKEMGSGKEVTKEVGKEEGKDTPSTEVSKPLPMCKGSYSKVRWTECKGVKRQYNGPHFIGQTYDGEFKEGRPHGHGDMTYHDGTRFVGVFEMGVRDGPGTEYAKNGALIREGFWRAGVLVKTYRTGDGKEGSKE